MMGEEAEQDLWSRDMEDFYDDEDGDCWNCGGEGFVADCVTEYACMYPEDGCDLCMRRCDFCNPAPRNPELDKIMADSLARPASAIEARRAATAKQGAVEDESAAPKGRRPNPTTTVSIGDHHEE